MIIRQERPEDYRAVEELTREAFWNVYRPGCTEHFVLNQYRNSPDFIPELDFVMEEDSRIIGHVMFSKAQLLVEGIPDQVGDDEREIADDDGGVGEKRVEGIPDQVGDDVREVVDDERGVGDDVKGTDYDTVMPGSDCSTVMPGNDRASHANIIPSWTFGPICIHPDYKRKGYGLKLLQYALEKAKELGVAFLCMEGNIEFYKLAGIGLASRLNIHYHSEPKEAEVPYFLAQELVPGWLAQHGIGPDPKGATYCPPKGYFVADTNPEAFEKYESTFPAKEKDFAPGQLPQFCQSCGMPLTRKEDCGSNADGSVNFDYCRYCYQDGKFLQDLTMDGMIEHCAQFVDEVNKNMPEPMTREQYKQMMYGFFPMLKRWRK